MSAAESQPMAAPILSITSLSCRNKQSQEVLQRIPIQRTYKNAAGAGDQLKTKKRPRALHREHDTSKREHESPSLSLPMTTPTKSPRDCTRGEYLLTLRLSSVFPLLLLHYLSAVQGKSNFSFPFQSSVVFHLVFLFRRFPSLSPLIAFTQIVRKSRTK